MSDDLLIVPNLVGGVSQQAPAVRLETQMEEQINAYGTIVDGLTKRPGSRWLTTVDTALPDDARVHAIERDGGEAYICVFREEAINIYQPDGTTVPVVLGPGVSDYSYLASADVSATSIQDTTIVSCADVVPAERAIIGGPSGGFDEHEFLLHVVQGAYSTDYTVTLNVNGTSYSHTVSTYDGITPGVLGKLDSIDTQDIAEEFRLALIALTASIPGVTVNSYGSSAGSSAIKGRVFESPIGGVPVDEFSVSVSDGLGGGAMTALHLKTQSFTDLPATAFDEFVIEIVGQSQSEQDNYWVVYQAEDPEGVQGYGSGAWVETVSPYSKVTYDEDTLPHKLERKQDDGAGTVTGTPNAIYFEWDVITWEPKFAGDDVTNPSPSFVGEGIKDVFFHSNRLGFVAGDSVIMSSSGSYFNFYRTTVRSLPDDDPIDFSVNSVDVASLISAHPYQDRLLVHSEEGQWSVTSETFLSPSSVEAQRIHSFEATPTVRPEVVGGTVFFLSPVSGFSGARELVRLDQDFYDAPSIAQQIPRYITEGADFMAASSPASVMVCGKRGTSDLFVFKWFDDGGRRIQSAWSKWSFNADSLYGAVFINSDLFILTERQGDLTLEKVGMWVGELYDSQAGSFLPGYEPFIPHVDCQIQIDDPQVSYTDDGQGDLVVTLPFDVDAGRDHVLISQSGGQRYVGVATAPNEVTFTDLNTGAAGVGDYTFGEQFQMTVEISQPIFRQETPRGGRVQIGDARTHLTRGYLILDRTGYLEIEVVIPEGTTTQTIGAEDLLNLTDGEFRFPILAQAKSTTIRFKSASPYPCRLTNLELNGRVARRASSR